MPKTIAAAYVRVSTEDQTEYSPAAQLEDIQEYAAAHNIHIPEAYIFIDEGISGKTAERRPAFIEMIKTARKKSNGIELILVHKFDRFSRKKEDQVLYKALLKKDGVKVISIKEPIPDDNKFAVIYESMLEAMSEYYSLNLAEEVKKTMVRKAEKGEYQSAAPFGYKNENKTLVIVPKEAELVRFIFDEFLNNDRPQKQIAEALNAMGIRTHRGNVFENRTIQYILHNPIYCGYVRWKPNGRLDRDFGNPEAIIAKSNIEPIIAEEMFKKTAEKLEEARRNYYVHKRPITEGKHWLSSMIKCSNCGRSLIVAKSFKYGGVFLQCGGYNHGQCDVSHSISSSALIPVILDELWRIATNTETTNDVVLVHRRKEADMSKAYNALIKKAESKLARAKEAYLAGVDTLAEYKANKSAYETEISDLKARVVSEAEANLVNPLNDPEYLEKIKKLCNTLKDEKVSMDDKKNAIRSLIEKIVYNKPTGAITIYLLA